MISRLEASEGVMTRCDWSTASGTSAFMPQPAKPRWASGRVR